MVTHCDAMSFYLDLDEGLVQLCPEACALVQNDKDASLEVDFTCEPLMPG